MKKPVLVIGSVLLDIVGTYGDSEDGLINKKGKLNFSIGGVAFNMASNLSSKGIPTSIITCLKSNSISSKVIEEQLKFSNINEFIYRSHQIDETGYVAHFCGKDLKTGITSSEIEEIDLKQIRNIPNLIDNSSFVILDTNLSTIQLRYLCSICLDKGKKIFVNVVSDAKFDRIYKKKFSKPFEAICIRKGELDSNNIFTNELIIDQSSISSFCSDVNSNTVFINSELNGYYILSKNGSYEYTKVKYPTPEIKNTLGANDALFSAVCASEYEKEAIDGDETKMKIKEWVTGILRSDRSNFEGIDSKINNQLNTIKVITTILFLILAIVSTVISSFTPDEDLNHIFFGLLLFSVASFGGASGALSREMVAQITNNTKRNLSMGTSIALGMTAGTLASFMGILPGIASGSGIEQLIKQDLLPIMVFIVSISTGIALDVFFDNLSKKNTHDLIEI